MNDYSDIINFNYQGPKNHQRMTKENRAAQFASFKALNGYDDNLKETRRIVDKKITLNEDKKELLDSKLDLISKNLNTKIKITFFIKDLKKSGGYYKTMNTNIKKIDYINKEIILLNNTKFKIDDILNIDILD